MTLKVSNFGSLCNIPKSFIDEIQEKTDIVQSVIAEAQAKMTAQMDKSSKSFGKGKRVLGIPKLEDANDAGTKHAQECTLILTEGDSAKSLAVAGLAVIGRDKYGVFPLRGKLLNVPALYKIFDEILVNAADNLQRDKNMNAIWVEIDGKQGRIKVYNNGKGLPIAIHKEHKVYVPELVFGHLLTSDNYDDTEKKVTGGRNGFGAKLTNIFSTKFIVETAGKGKIYRQQWNSNMSRKFKPENPQGGRRL